MPRRAFVGACQSRDEDAVTLTASFAELHLVSEAHVISGVDQSTRFLESLHHLVHAGATRTEHVRKELLADPQVVDSGPIADEQQPACETLLDRMQTVADGRL